jgi:hypothetical protein
VRPVLGGNAMTTDIFRDAQELPTSFKFAARKVRLGREFYVEAVAPDRRTYRIGSFKFRGRAQDWIKAHATSWRPDQTDAAALPCMKA